MTLGKSEVRQLTEKEGYTVEAVKHIDEGSDELYLIERDGENLVFKSRGFEQLPASWFRKEPLMLEKVSEETDMPVPKVLEYNNDHETPHFLMELMEGESLSSIKQDLSEDSLEKICYNAGKVLAELHSSINYEEYGWIEEKDGKLIRKEMEWQEVFESMIDHRLDNFEDTEFGEYKEKAEDYLDGKIEALDPDKAVLGHDDFRPGNIMIKENDVVGVIDWARAFAVDPNYELVNAETHYMNELETLIDEEKVSKKFREGYSTVRDIDISQNDEMLYRLNSYLGLMKGFSNHWGDLIEDSKKKEKMEYLENKLEECII